MSSVRTKSLSELLADRTVIDKALRQGVRNAMLQHKQAGNPIVIWRDGKVVWVPAQEIEISDSDESRTHPQ